MTRTIIAVLLFVFSAGCGEKPDTNRERTNRRSLTPEQAVIDKCAEDVSRKWVKPKMDASKAEMLITSDNSSDYIDAVLARRRMEEQACLEDARCFQANGKLFNGVFAACMDAK